MNADSPVAPPEEMDREELSREELAVATSPDHPLAGVGPLPLAALVDQHDLAM